MFLSLERPGDKQVTLFARNLRDEPGYQSHGGNGLSCDGDRSRFNAAVQDANENMGGDGRRKAFGNLFNQFNWRGTSGWEYGLADPVLVLRHALQVAEELQQPLAVHKDVLISLLPWTDAAGVKFDWETVGPVGELQPGDDMPLINRRLEAGEYYVLKDIAFPKPATEVVS